LAIGSIVRVRMIVIILGIISACYGRDTTIVGIRWIGRILR